MFFYCLSMVMNLGFFFLVQPFNYQNDTNKDENGLYDTLFMNERTTVRLLSSPLVKPNDEKKQKKKRTGP